MKGRSSTNPQGSIRERHEAVAPSSRLQVLWLQPSADEGMLPPPLRERLAAHSLVLSRRSQEEEPGEAWRNFDLILLRVTDQPYGQIREMIHQIRAHNRAPIMLLIDQQIYEWTLVALPAGADTVVLVDAPTEIIVARCLALLRRWLSGA